MALDDKARLKKLIIDRALVVSRDPIILSSGFETNHYFDLKKVTSDAEGLRLISVLMIEEIAKLGRAKSVGGLEIGAIPIAVGISRESLGNENMHSFFVRKQAKAHGLRNLIEGDVIEPVVIVDDVITKGDSVLKAIDAIKSKWKHMLGVVSIIDRGGGKENLQAIWKIKHVSLFEDRDFEEAVKEKLANLNA